MLSWNQTSSGTCGKNLTLQFFNTNTLSQLQLTLVISGTNVVKLLFNSSAHNSTFYTSSQTQFGASEGFSYACNSTFTFAHGYDKLYITNVVFEAAMPFNQGLSPAGLCAH